MSKKPAAYEEEYFKRQEFMRIKKAEEENTKAISLAEKERLRELHYMKCPKCGMQLIEIQYRGLKVDKCSACDGIWFDSGEFEVAAELNKTTLDKLFAVFKK